MQNARPFLRYVMGHKPHRSRAGCKLQTYLTNNTSKTNTKSQRKENIMTKQYTAPELWNIYKAEVGGQSFQGTPLPEFDDLGEKQKSGWQKLADTINEREIV